MVPFFGISDADLATWRAAMGIPAEALPPPEPVVCEICETPVDQGETFVECEGAPPANRKRLFHDTCLTMHLIRNEDNLQDEITAFVTRKPICNTETPSSSSQITSSEDIVDDSHFGDL